MTKFHKDQFVEYDLYEGHKVEAIVRRTHRDGSVTVEARHVRDPEGNIRGCYLGYRYRYAPSILRLAS